MPDVLGIGHESQSRRQSALLGRRAEFTVLPTIIDALDKLERTTVMMLTATKDATLAEARERGLDLSPNVAFIEANIALATKHLGPEREKMRDLEKELRALWKGGVGKA